MTVIQQEKYFTLIDALLQCSAGQEPEVLDQHLDLLDAEFVTTLIQVATAFAHQNQQDAAQFLVHVARNLARELGLYPQVEAAETARAGSQSEC